MSRRFGILTLASGPIGDLRRYWQTAEDLGFTSAWVADSVSLPGLVDYEAWTILGALAEQTSHMRVGTLVTQIPFRHPTILAAQAITLDHLTAGRLELGIGAGDYAADNAAIGMAPWSFSERRARFEEQLSILDRALRGERVDFTGRFYTATAVQLAAPRQRPRPPLLVAGQVPQTLQLVARFADGWNSLGGQPLGKSGLPPLPLAEAAARTHEQVLTLEEFCRRLGRDAGTIRRSVLPYRASVDPLSSLEAFDEFVGRYEEAGISEFIFYWPPVESLKRKEPVSRSQQTRLEQIARARIATVTR